MVLILKITSYISSMFPFSIYVFFLYMNDTYRFKYLFGITPQIAVWSLMIAQICSIIYVLYFYLYKIKKDGNNFINAKFYNLKAEKTNTSNYILANVLPIATVDLDTELKSIFIILILILLGIMYVKNNLYYINPLYDLLGIKVYQGDAKFDINGVNKGDEEILIITRSSLHNTTEDNINEYSIVKGGNSIYFHSKK